MHAKHDTRTLRQTREPVIANGVAHVRYPSSLSCSNLLHLPRGVTNFATGAMLLISKFGHAYTRHTNWCCFVELIYCHVRVLCSMIHLTSLAATCNPIRQPHVKRRAALLDVKSQHLHRSLIQSCTTLVSAATNSSSFSHHN